MPAFGLNRFTLAYAVAVNDAGTRIGDRPLSCVDRLAFQLFEWGGGKPLDLTFRFIYPFVGGTAVSNSFNLADPSVGRIEWEGEPVHNANGVTGNALDAVGRTGVALAGTAIADSFLSFGVYSRTASTGSYAEIGNYGYSNVAGLLIYSRYTDGHGKWYSGTGLSSAVTNSQGMFSCLRTTNAALYGYRNGVLIISATTAFVVQDPPGPLLLLARPDNDAINELPPIFFTNRNLAFAFMTNASNTSGIGAIFTSVKQTELYNYVQSFQTKQGRNV